MSSAGVGVLRATYLLVLLRMRRLGNMIGAVSFSRRARKGVAGKQPSRLLGIAVTIAMVWTFTKSASTALEGLYADIADPEVMKRAAILRLAALMLTAVVVTLGSRELAKPDWDLEWLVTMPTPRWALLVARLVERTIVNSVGFLALVPMLGLVCAETYGNAWGAILGYLLALPLLLVLAVVQTVVDTGLRLRLSAPSLRNLQAVLAMGGVAGILLLSTQHAVTAQLAAVAAKAPGWVWWTPPGLAYRAASRYHFADLVGWAGALVAMALVITAVGLWLLQWQLRDGVVLHGGRESSGRRGKSAARSSTTARVASAGPVSASERSALLSPLLRRELRLLSRDRSFLVQTLVLPSLIVASQFLVNGREMPWSIGGSPKLAATFAFGLAAYTLLFSAFQTLNAEGGALWILYTLPQPLHEIVQRKVRLWGALATGLAIVILAYAASVAPANWGLEGVFLAAMVLWGVPVYALIAGGLGVFAANPLASAAERRIHPKFLYLYMLLAAFYGQAFFQPGVWVKLVLLVLSTLLALALWQKARDHLPYLLDPTAAPPAQVSLADGIIALMLFFVLQLVCTLAEGKVDWPSMTRAFSVAGIATFVVFRWRYWASKAEGVPRYLGKRPVRDVVVGVMLGAVVAGGAYVYLRYLPQMPWAPKADETIGPGLMTWQDRAWLTLIAVVAAPLCEEFIFRGLVFGGLRRSMRALPAAVASAALFAIVHPPVAAIPVGVMGLVAALLTENTGALLAGVAAHATYNAIVVWGIG
jgi:membrane protease YdiL (CAAX protease family)